ncbi:hypothetical protein M011DRAFT_482333 [Sporormia fimetaria CBS 119925]|uniref:Uncharacterized protein n=1 Tax=Sporormia fimetaria CBS 119925 TaxID=1340428 RepID=A0A6A6UW33_9PLEO|nr:hypothetical protein M011DRAFT_482333 [Sporormia fimetaria CBS 119925]
MTAGSLLSFSPQLLTLHSSSTLLSALINPSLSPPSTSPPRTPLAPDIHSYCSLACEAAAIMDYACKELLDDIARQLQPLREERDLWRTRAEAYKAAFEEQTHRLREAIEIVIAAKIELEHLRSLRHSQRPFLHSSSPRPVHIRNVSECSRSSNTLVSDASFDHCKAPIEWQSNALTQSHFGRVEQLVACDDLAKARDEIDRILPARLPNDARVEGLLLKSVICRASGPDWSLEALAQCSEALSLCQKLSELHRLLPKVQYHRGLCLLRLRELEQARDAFAAVGPCDPLHAQATKHRTSCDDELEFARLPKSRYAFDEHRTVTEGFLYSLKDFDSNRVEEHRARRVASSHQVQSWDDDPFRAAGDPPHDSIV